MHLSLHNQNPSSDVACKGFA